MRIFIAFLTLLACSPALAQQPFTPVDRKQVETQVTDASAGTYYPKLVERLRSYDTTLTLEEYRLLYYGFVFQPEYAPYSNDKSKEIQAAFEKGKYDEAIRYCDEIISTNPVALRNYYYKLLAISKSNPSDSSFEKLRNQYFRFLDAIVSTGDGKTCETAFKVITVSDEYDVMYRYLETEKVLSQTLQTPCDKMKITPSNYFKESNVFFDVSESFRAMEKMFKK